MDVKVVGGGHNLARVAVEVAVISLKVYRKGGYLSEIFPIKVQYCFWLLQWDVCALDHLLIKPKI